MWNCYTNNSTTIKEKNIKQKNKEKEKNIIYTVKKGDNLSGIASRHGVSVNEILKKNNGLKADKLQIGQKIKIK